MKKVLLIALLAAFSTIINYNNKNVTDQKTKNTTFKFYVLSDSQMKPVGLVQSTVETKCQNPKSAIVTPGIIGRKVLYENSDQPLILYKHYYIVECELL